jgi:hypothetical protein
MTIFETAYVELPEFRVLAGFGASMSFGCGAIASNSFSGSAFR